MKFTFVLQKTDDEDFYRFSLDGFKEAGFEVISVCEDYRAPDADDGQRVGKVEVNSFNRALFDIFCKHFRRAACGDLVKMADLTDKNMQRASLTPEYVPFNDVFGNANPLRL